MIRTEPVPGFLDDVERVFLPRDAASEYHARAALLRYCVRRAPPGDWAEFGVKRGKSARMITRRLPRGARFFLLDSWQGLPEPFAAGGAVKPAGHFKVPKPRLPYRGVELIEGWFAETGADLRAKTDRLAFIHIDCDLYSSTAEALDICTPLIVEGTVIAFDELWGFENWQRCEHRALAEWLDATGFQAQWIARTESCQAALALRL